MTATLTGFDGLWETLAELGRDQANGGYRRLPWTAAELACRDWFGAQAATRGLPLELDRNGNLWAWWGDPNASEAVVTGSHLDSVADGGAYDGALGIVCAFAAVDAMRAASAEPVRPIAIVSFTEEEGGRFGRACVGSKLLTGALDPREARGLRDAQGVTLADCLYEAGIDPDGLGAEPRRVARISAYVEAHIEQGRQLVHADSALGVATEIWPHGRYRFDFEGEANHAGTTPLELRRDPTLNFARATLAARDAATVNEGFATFGRLRVEPNSTNAIASLVAAWLDVRGPDERVVDAIVSAVAEAGECIPERESWTPAITFDAELRERLTRLLAAPCVSTAAGHDAAILAAAGVPSAMIFVRNRTGISHAPNELADRADCLAAVDALANVLTDLACR